MAEPDWNPDTGGRSLAEILREAGIESANRAARRRSWDDPEETGIRQRRAEAAAARRPDLGRRSSDRSDLGRRSSDQADEPPPIQERRAVRRSDAPDPSTAAIPGMRPDRKPGVPTGGAHPSAPIPPMRERRPSEPERVERRLSQRGAVRSTERPAERSPDRSPDRSPERLSGRLAQRGAPVDPHPTTGPIPVVRPDQFEDADDLDSTPQESALAWLRFAGELIIALAAGVGVYLAATLLWENIPHVAVLLAPIAVSGLVTGVGMWRQRQGREPVGPRLLAILVFAGTLLTIAPAAGLLAGGG
jgi:hypothetical protein